jgi:prephenate dehydratase
VSCESLVSVTAISVAFLGPAHTYSHLAAQMIQPDERLLRPCDTIDQVFAAIESRTAQCGLVPLFNTTSGLVSDSVVAIVRRLVGRVGGVVGSQRSILEAERRTPGLPSDGLVVPTTQLCISESMVVSIQHCLVSWGTLASIRTVSSKQQALEQCQKWLDKNLAHAVRIATDSSAAALADLKNHPAQAAIVSRSAALSLQAPLCVEAIQDQMENATEFVVVQLDAEWKPILRLRQEEDSPVRCEYLIAELATESLGPSHERTEVIQAAGSQTRSLAEESRLAPGVSPPGSLTLGPWSGRVYWEGGWYEACKRPISELLPADRPWTGQLAVPAEPASPATTATTATTATGRRWRLGMG